MRTSRVCIVLMCVFVSVVGRGARGRSLVTWMQGDIEASSGSLYQVNLPFGTPQQSQVMLTFDLASSRTLVPCTSKRSNAQSFHPKSSVTFHKVGKRKCTLSNCTYPAQDYLSLSQRSVYYLRPDAPFLSNSTLVTVPYLAILCSINRSSHSPSTGSAAFSDGSLALPAQLALRAGLARVFAYCLPSYIIFGSRPEGYVFQSFPDPPVNYSMDDAQTTPLIVDVNDAAGGYAVSLEDISVGGEFLNLVVPFKLYISTTDRYTKLESSVYAAVQDSFRRHIGYDNATARSGVVAVQAVQPFATCFNNSSPAFSSVAETFFGSADAGRIDLRLSGGLTWSFFTDSLVNPRYTDVLCLAIVDSGPNQPSVLGTAQQEGRLVLLDLDKRSLAMAKVDNLGFEIPGSLYRQRTCANFV